MSDRTKAGPGGEVKGLELTYEEILEFLDDCPAFAPRHQLGTSPRERQESLAQLAGCLAARFVPRGERVYPATQLPSERSFALVYLGVVVTPQRQAWSDRWRSPAGGLVGFDAVWNWAHGIERSSGAGPVQPVTQDDTWLLECPPEAWGQAFGDPSHAPFALRGVLRVHQLWKWKGPAQEALWSSPALEGLTHQHADYLIERARLRPVRAGEPAWSEGTRAMFAILHGRLGWHDRDDNPGPPRRELVPGTLLGAPETLAGNPLEYTVHAKGEALLLEFPYELMEEAWDSVPGFLALRPPPGSGRAPSRSRTQVVVVLDAMRLEEEGEPAPLVSIPTLCEAAAELLRRSYRDRVRVVRLGPASFGEQGDVWGCRPDELLAVLREQCGAEGRNVLIVDASAYPLPRCRGMVRRLLADLAVLPAPKRVTLFIDDSEDWLDLLQVVPPQLRRWAFPTAVLRPLAPVFRPQTVITDLGHLEVGKALKAAAGLVPWCVRWGVELTKRELRLIPGVTRLLDSQRRREQVWPLNSVRVRFPARALRAWRTDPRSSARAPSGAGAHQEAEASLARWARALVGRRIGVSIAGAGAQSYAGAAMLRKLREISQRQLTTRRFEAPLPVDLISGTSFGSVVGAFYSSQGHAGIDQLVRDWSILFWNLFWVTWWNSAGIEFFIDWCLGFRQVDQLELPFFPVSTEAADFREHVYRWGTLGEGVRMASSLPPFIASTIRGRQRYLDGALSGNPILVLSDAGADLIVAVNPCPVPPDIPTSFDLPWIPIVTPWVEYLSPLVRALDAFRGYLNTFRLSSGPAWRYSIEAAHVTYAAKHQWVQPWEFYLGPQALAYEARSEELHTACQELFARWYRLLPGLGEEEDLQAPLDFETREDPRDPLFAPREQLTSASLRHLHVLADRLQNGLTSRVVISSVAAAQGSVEGNLRLAERRAEQVRRQLLDLGVAKDRVEIAPASGHRLDRCGVGIRLKPAEE